MISSFPSIDGIDVVAELRIAPESIIFTIKDKVIN
jgi:hypothetical protein